MTPQEEVKLIKEDLEFNKNFKFKYEPRVIESTFDNQMLKDVVSSCYAASLEVDPSIVQELIHAEIRARTKAMIESKLKGRSVSELAEASAEINAHLLEGLLTIKKSKLETPDEPLTETPAEQLETPAEHLLAATSYVEEETTKPKKKK